jgi:hypothetical protein
VTTHLSHTDSADEKLAQLLLHYRSNPLSFIRDVIGAEPTQQQIDLIEAATVPHARVGVKSATSTGKTAALVWLSMYFMTCYPYTKVIVTAPTSGQLHRAFRSEWLTWHSTMNSAFAEFYEIMATQMHIKGKKGIQFIDLVTGTAENKESFAGIHSKKGKTIIIVDEASALPDEIFDTLYGTLSSGDTAFILVSNPVRNSGKFYELFQQRAADPDALSNWTLMTFTSYDSPNVGEEWIKETIEYYGEESDFVKMRIWGEFPVVSNAQFFPSDLINDAKDRNLSEKEYYHYDRVLGVDVARFGDDSSVIVDRQGPKIHSIECYNGVDTATFSSYILNKYHKGRYAAIFVDGIGVGAGVVDQLAKFNLPVVDVVVSSKSTDPKTYFDLRAQVYGEMKNWLSTADLPPDRELLRQLPAIYYSYNNKLQQYIESKKEMKKREGYSPDIIDAIAYSFADNVYKVRKKYSQPRPVVKSDRYMYA